MADLYRVIYVAKRSDNQKSVVVSATSAANAVSAAITNDADHKQHISATVIQQNIIAGS